MADWNETQKHEAEYWGNCLGMRAWGEFVKQEMYAREMGLWEAYGNGTGELVMGQRSVLDVGGGPVSMTLRCLNARYPTVVDPCEWPASVQRTLPQLRHPLRPCRLAKSWTSSTSP